MSYPLTSGPGAANAAVVLPVAGRIGARVALSGIVASYSAAPAGGRLQVTGNNSGRGIDVDIAAAGPFIPPTPLDGMTFDVGESVTLTLAAGGAAVVGKINVAVDYVPPE